MNNNRKKILFICPFPQGLQAGQRLKYEQQFKKFQENGFEISVKPFMDINLFNIVYVKGYLFKKIYGAIKGYIKRFLLIFTLYKYDVIYIFLWVTPFFDTFFEKIYVRLSKKIIYDIEDNVFVILRNKINPITFYIKSKKKFIYLIKESSTVIASSVELANKCNNIAGYKKSYYIPPGINKLKYSHSIKYRNSDQITIGWTGTFSSKKYLKLVEPVLIKLSKSRKIIFRVISNFNYEHNQINVERIEWNKKTEIQDLLGIDIGIYPLFNEEWILGKSGLKAIQYMALGIPTVASNVGNTREVIEHMIDGILVNSEHEWYDSFINLIDNIELRKILGINAKKKIMNKYNLDIISKKYLEILNN